MRRHWSYLPNRSAHDGYGERQALLSQGRGQVPSRLRVLLMAVPHGQLLMDGPWDHAQL